MPIIIRSVQEIAYKLDIVLLPRFKKNNEQKVHPVNASSSSMCLCVCVSGSVLVHLVVTNILQHTSCKYLAVCAALNLCVYMKYLFWFVCWMVHPFDFPWQFVSTECELWSGAVSHIAGPHLRPSCPSGTRWRTICWKVELSDLWLWRYGVVSKQCNVDCAVLRRVSYIAIFKFTCSTIT